MKYLLFLLLIALELLCTACQKEDGMYQPARLRLVRKTAELTVDKAPEMEVASVVFVVDNSGSMGIFQAQLSKAVASMVERLPTDAKVDFSVYSTTEFEGPYLPTVNLGESFGTFAQPLSLLSFGAQHATSVNQRVLQSGGKPVLETTFGVNRSLFPTENGVIQWRPEMSEEERRLAKTSLQKGLEVGTSGAIEEQGLCNLLRLAESPESSPFARGKSSIVVMITDTDPYKKSGMNNCFKGFRATYEERLDNWVRFGVTYLTMEGELDLDRVCNDGAAWCPVPGAKFAFGGCKGSAPCNALSTLGKSFACTPAQREAFSKKADAYYGAGKWRFSAGGGCTAKLEKSRLIVTSFPEKKATCSSPLTDGTRTFANYFEHAKSSYPSEVVSNDCREIDRADNRVLKYLSSKPLPYEGLSESSEAAEISDRIHSRIAELAEGKKISFIGIGNLPELGAAGARSVEVESASLRLLAGRYGEAAKLFSVQGEDYSEVAREIEQKIVYREHADYRVPDDFQGRIISAEAIIDDKTVPISTQSFVLDGRSLHFLPEVVKGARLLRLVFEDLVWQP